MLNDGGGDDDDDDDGDGDGCGGDDVVVAVDILLVGLSFVP